MVGAGPAGLAFASVAAERGHDVTLFDAADEVGEQFNVAKRIPGKTGFHETIRYFKQRLNAAGVKFKLSTKISAEDVKAFDSVVLATGVHPERLPSKCRPCQSHILH